jgi:hypothetical protein
MSHNSLRSRDARPKDLDNRLLRLEPLEPRLTLDVAANFLGLLQSSLATYVKNLSADGAITRMDMVNILRSVRRETDGYVDSADLHDLRTIVQNASVLHMPLYVSVLASDVVYSNTANGHYQGKTLGNLTVGSSNIKLAKLTDKWFFGTDLPTTNSYAYAYARTSGSMYGNSSMPWYRDEKQGHLGDCYLIAALGSIAQRSASAINRMFTWNGDGTWTVRFFSNGKADYVTVNRYLPVNSNGQLVYDGHGLSYWNSSNSLWLPLLEKAYAQWNETGKTQQGTYTNSYTGIEGGWMDVVYNQALGYSIARRVYPWAYNAKGSILDAMYYYKAVTVATINNPNYSSTHLHGNHAYNVLSYNSTTGRFTLYNPWGYDHPYTLTWSQLQANANFYSTVTTMSVPAGRVSRDALVVSFMTLPTNAITATANTLDGIAVENNIPLAPAAVDAVFVDRVAMTNIAEKTTATTFRSDKWWLNESSLSVVAANNAARPSDNAFANIDSLFDSIESHVALAL